MLTQTQTEGTSDIQNVPARPRAETLPPTMMRVTKRDGSSEPVDLNKIVRAVARCAAGLEHVDAMRVATRTISGLVDGATTEDLDNLSIL